MKSVDDLGAVLSGAIPPKEMEVANVKGGVAVHIKRYGIAFILSGNAEGTLKSFQRYNGDSKKREDLVLLTRQNLTQIKKLALDKILNSDYGTLAWAGRGGTP